MWYFAIKLKIIETIPPIRKRTPIILNPSPSSLRDIILIPNQMQMSPNATSIIPAVKKGLKSAPVHHALLRNKNIKTTSHF
jgi:hypothetical protein